MLPVAVTESFQKAFSPEFFVVTFGSKSPRQRQWYCGSVHCLDLAVCVRSPAILRF